MASKLQELKWQAYNYKSRKLLLWGLKKSYITPYNDELIKKLRTIYDGGIPASILLLSDGMSNGFCYDRALLMARAFLDEDVDVKLLYASVDCLRLNPKLITSLNPNYADHCVVCITSKLGKQFIIDTSSGFIYDKNLYFLMEHPKIRKINDKDAIIKFVESQKHYYPEDIENDKYIAPSILPIIEMTYGQKNELYSMEGLELLQREIEHFKEVINYDKVCHEIDEDMEKLRLKK